MPDVAITSDIGRALLIVACMGMLATAVALAIAHEVHYEDGVRRASQFAVTSGIFGALALVSALIRG